MKNFPLLKIEVNNQNLEFEDNFHLLCRITSQIDPLIHNLAFGEKLFEESEMMWKNLFESADGRDWPATHPDLGGEKMIRITRVLLAALLT